MAKHLTRMAIDKVSLVDRGANGRRIAVLKRQNRQPLEPEPQEERGIVAKVLGSLGFEYDADSGTVVKADTFGDIRAREAATEAADDGFRIMQDAFWSAQFARDENGEPLSTEAKRAMVETSLGQFSAYLLDAMTVEKAGRKISGSRLARMKDAMRILGEVIEGVEAGWWAPPEDAVAKESDDMTEEQINALVAKAVEDQMAGMLGDDGAIAKAVQSALSGIEVTKTTTVEGATEAEVEVPEALTKRLDEFGETQGQIIEAVSKLLDRVEGLEGSRRQALPIGEEPVQKRSPLAGILTG